MAKLSGLYAAALYELVVESGNPEAVLDQTFILRDALKDAATRRILVHPNISNTEKREFFQEAFAGGLDGHLLSFICLTIDKNREVFIVPALNRLIALLRKRLNRTTAKVVSAAELSDRQTAAMKALLEGKLQKKVELETDTDPSVIGGAHIQTDGYFIDRTLKRRLSELTLEMKERCGA